MADEERNYEEEASKEGWAPQDQWKGDPDRWKTAEQFVKDGEKIVPILKSKVDRLEARVEEVLQTNKKFSEFTQRSLDREKAEKDRLIKELEEVRKQAVTESDGDAFAKADSQLEEIRNSNKPEETPALAPAAQAWLGQNNWYGSNEDLTIFADIVSDKLVADGYTHSSPAYFKELTDRIHKRFPDEFGNKNRAKPSSVESGGEKETGSKSKTFDNLPAEAKRAYQQFKRDIPGFTKEQYVENYEFGEDE
jgi:hypothetical protein